MKKGYNKAILLENLRWVLESSDIKKRPCVFISHKREDKAQCREIAKYLKQAEIDYYLDEEDDVLQTAASSNMDEPGKLSHPRRIKVSSVNQLLGFDLSVG